MHMYTLLIAHVRHDNTPVMGDGLASSLLLFGSGRAGASFPS